MEMLGKKSCPNERHNVHLKLDMYCTGIESGPSRQEPVSNRPRYCTALHVYKAEKKVKVTLEQATKAQKWSRGIAVLFL
jgi:hypothetical protein